jgi:hypothetical protein
MAVDTGTTRTSGCPVHFIWDGKGVGRPVVRAGFMLLLVASMVAVAVQMWHLPSSWTRIAASVAGTVYLTGQALSFVVSRLAATVPPR